MIIEIVQADGPIDFNGYHIYCKKKKVYNSNALSRTFDESDIYELLDNKQYKHFENGKYIFNVTKKRIFDVTKDNDFYYTI